MKNKHFKLIYKNKSYIDLNRLFLDLNIYDNTHYLILIKIDKNILFKIEYTTYFLLYTHDKNEPDYWIHYIIKYYHKKYNIKFI
jgi:hypothetical protein